MNQLVQLAEECRSFLIDTILHSGGHFAGNLGVTELTIALMHCLDPDTDRILWDVGHQSYIHKMLTGRRDQLHTIRSFGGLSGFPLITENPHDAFGTGHSSTAVSAALGMATAAGLRGESSRLFAAVIGDGALTGGEAFEALNNAASTKANVLIVINDNHIGIDPNTGAVDQHLQHIETQAANLFTVLNLPYHGPVDGHDLPALTAAVMKLKHVQGPRVLHVRTVKGKGYPPAEAEQTRWHSTSRYVKIEPAATDPSPKWHEVAGAGLKQLAAAHHTVVGITPAMPTGSGLPGCFEAFPDRFFDVGIAEQHAVTFAAGMAREGMRPYLVIYSTFLQRGYDQLIHDVALQNLPVVFMIDRAGLVGEDGPTHHGVFDIPALSCIPGMKIWAPAWKEELMMLMEQALLENGPVAIRYPKGSAPAAPVHIQSVTAVKLRAGSRTAVVSTGHATNLVLEAAQHAGFEAAHFHMPLIKPLDMDLVNTLSGEYDHIITVEDGAINGGMGMQLLSAMHMNGFSGTFRHLGVPDRFVPHGSNRQLYTLCGFDPAQILEAVRQASA